MGMEINAIAMTWAATVPVMAPRMKPTMITEYPRPPRIGPKSCPIRVEHVFGKTASFEHSTHEREERYRQEQVVRKNVAKYPARYRLQIIESKTAVLDGNETEEEAEGGERKRYR